MTSKSPPSSPSTRLVPYPNSRRGSLASVSSRIGIDKEVLAQALDDIHSSASKSEALTSFHDFDGKSGRSGPKEIVSNGVTGLYNRFRQSVSSSVPKDAASSVRSSARVGSSDATSLRSLSPTLLKTTSGHRSRRSITASIPSEQPSDSASPVSQSFPRSSRSGADDSAIQALQSQAPGRQQGLSSAFGNFETETAPEPVPQNTHANIGQMSFDQSLANPRSTKSTTRPDEGPSINKLPIVPPGESVDHVVSDITPGSDFMSQQDGNLIEMDDSDYGDDLDSSSLPQMPGEKPSNPSFDDDTLADDTVNHLPDQAQPPVPYDEQLHVPGFDSTRASSLSDAVDSIGPRVDSRRSYQTLSTPSPNLNVALQRRRTGYRPQLRSLSATQDSLAPHLKRRILSKDFWMRDENAKVCFRCGLGFSTFRRKHHCRTCGQIFDDKCTSQVSGKPFGQSGNIRLCKPCEEMVFDSDDDSTVLSDGGDERTWTASSPTFVGEERPEQNVESAGDNARSYQPDRAVPALATPSIGIRASRRNREAKRRSAVIEFDTQPSLGRPTSSHSLISLNRRPKSAGHRRRLSKHQPNRSFRQGLEERGPFYPEDGSEMDRRSALPTFHNDNVIDPELAPYLSEEGSDDDDQPNLAMAVEGMQDDFNPERDRLGLGNIFTSAFRKGRSKFGDRATATSSVRGVKDEDYFTQAPRVSAKLLKEQGPPNQDRQIPHQNNGVLASSAGERDPVHIPRISSDQLMQPNIRASRSSSIERGDYNPDNSLTAASYTHMQRLLSQLLRDARIPSASTWEKALMPILVHCAENVEPDVPHGDDMDIRHYVKLKKVTGGKPTDTDYVSGVVFSKNLALKVMPRHISSPRIAIVTFSIEYARHEAHFMSLEPVIAQEQEYLQNLINRIAALRPQVLLVQRHISGLALRMLHEAGIVVAFNIKESVLAAVARMTETTMIKSIDKLGLDPNHLGHCDNFEVRTYICDGVRKSYIYLSGCGPDLGCTIVLRGADTKTLRHIKRITEFMCYVAYNLRLEHHLMIDEFACTPFHTGEENFAMRGLNADSRNRPKKEYGVPFSSLSTSMSETKYEDIEKETCSRLLSASPFVNFTNPYLLTNLCELEKKLKNYKMLRDQYAAADEDGEDESLEQKDIFQLVRPEMVNAPASKDQPKTVREYLHAVHEAQLEKAMHAYETLERQWDSFISGEIDPFDPFSHQKIVVLYSSISTITSAPCTGPEVLGIGFYAGPSQVESGFDEDITLGQYVEDLCLGAGSACKGCGKRMTDHHRQYVHGGGQLSVSVKRQMAQSRGLSDRVLMWASCRKCPPQDAPVTEMSARTWQYSFAKYLELNFWGKPFKQHAGTCEHDIRKDFLRCFGYRGFVLCFQYDPIEIYEVVVPRARVTWKVEADLTVKNEQYVLFSQRLRDFTDSIKKRLDSINVDTLDEKRSVEAHDVIATLRNRAQKDHEELLQKLQHKYTGSRYYELIPLNRALRFMDEKAIAWDEAFNNFERDYFPSENDIRKLASLQLRNMFLELQPIVQAHANDADSKDTEADAHQVEEKTVEGKQDQSDLKKANEVLSSILEEQKSPDATTCGADSQKLNSTDTVSTNDLVLTRSISPRKEQEDTVESQEVRHLDLALSSIPHPEIHDPSTVVSSPPGPLDCPGADYADRGSTAEIAFSTQPKPLSSGLLERIEQIRNTRTTTDQGVPESRIPRLVDLQKQEMSSKSIPPPLLRTRSQPSNLPRGAIEMPVEPHDETHPAVSPSPDGLSHEKRPGEKPNAGRFVGKNGKVPPSMIPRSVPPKAEDSNVSTVSALARHFEQMSREFEKERLKERRQRALKSRQARANPLASSKPIVEVYQSTTEAVGEKREEAVFEDGRNTAQHTDPSREADNLEGENSFTYQTSSEAAGTAPPELDPDTFAEDEDSLREGANSDVDDASLRPREISDSISGTSSLLSPSSPLENSDLSSELAIPEHRKNVWFKYLSEFWSKRSASGWTNLEYPLHTNEHVFQDSDIIVREDEPASVIALALACADYQAKVKDFRAHPNRQNLQKHGHGASHPIPDKSDAHQSQDIEASLLSDTGTHMKYSFAHGSVKASCKIFYAESFDALRRRCGVADRFIESMSRCLKIDTKGGKTKSLFLRTLDKRFIIKSLQEVELKAFTKFAPDYFDFMSHTLFHGAPSVIAKMFGLFQVNIRNPSTGLDFSYYLLVMENLFYERNPNRRFDLKGSMRNRKIEATGQADEVLLDENLVETIFESPLFVREQSRKLLHASIFNDTLWLCKQNVMDYSLMAGFDDTRKELIVGIIDCIRTYTWDKKVESWLKDRGKGKLKPTITSPKDYRNRFRESMRQYVLQAPNCWHQFHAQMLQPKTLKDREDKDETEDTESERI